MARDPRRKLLKNVPLFAGCSDRELSRIAPLMTEISVESGHVLTREGDVGREFFVIADGRAKVTRKGRRVAALDAGGFFGEMALLTQLPRNATVVAETDMTIYVIDPREFATMLSDAPGVARKLLAALAERVHATES